MNIQDRIQELLSVSEPALLGLHPLVRSYVLKTIEVAAYGGLYFGAFQGGRTWAHQAALYAQGRQSLNAVNSMRKIASLTSISELENRKTVTKADAGDSWHNYFLAVDMVEDGDPNRAGIQWSWKNTSNYVKLGKVVVSIGLEWGGLWKAFTDYPHVQLSMGIPIATAKSLYLTHGGLPAVWAVIDRRLEKAA